MARICPSSAGLKHPGYAASLIPKLPRFPDTRTTGWQSCCVCAPTKDGFALRRLDQRETLQCFANESAVGRSAGRQIWRLLVGGSGLSTRSFQLADCPRISCRVLSITSSRHTPSSMPDAWGLIAMKPCVLAQIWSASRSASDAVLRPSARG